MLNISVTLCSFLVHNIFLTKQDHPFTYLLHMIILKVFLVKVLAEILNYVINSVSDDSTGENL